MYIDLLVFQSYKININYLIIALLAVSAHVDTTTFNYAILACIYKGDNTFQIYFSVASLLESASQSEAASRIR